MIHPLNHFLIAIPSVFDEGDIDGIKHLNSAHYIDQERDRFSRKLRLGIIFRAPLAYTEARHMPIDPGLPNPRLFLGHDAIQAKVNEGYAGWEERYHPGMTEHMKFLTKADYGRLITAIAGDPIYFHPSVTEPEKYIGEVDGLKIYLAEVHELISVGTRTQGFYVLVEPHIEERTHGDVVLSVDESDKMLEGTVRYCREGAPVKPGDFVYFQEDSNWDFEIVGKRYFAMLEENVVLTVTEP